MTAAWLLLLTACSLLPTALLQTTSQELPLNLVELPPGFSITLYQLVPDARQLALSEGENPQSPEAVIVYVGSTDLGAVTRPCV